MSLTPQQFGAVGDGKYGNSGAILAGSDIFTAVDAAFTGSDAGKLFKLGKAGPGGATHLTTIAQYLTPTSVRLAVPASAAVAGMFYSYATDDTIALKAARDYCWANGRITMELPGDHRYGFTENLEWAQTRWALLAGPNMWLDSFCSVPGYSFSVNGTTYDPVYGIHLSVYGGQFPINVDGTSFSSAVIYYNSIFWCDSFNVRYRNGNIGVLGNNSGAILPGPRAAAVGVNFDVRGANHDMGPMHVTPAVGYYMSYTYVSKVRAQLEVGQLGLYAAQSNGIKLDCGTMESNNAGGARITASCERWEISSTHNEYNGSAPDWLIEAKNVKFISAAGAGTNGPNLVVGGAQLRAEGSKFKHVKVLPGTFPVFEGGQIDLLEDPNDQATVTNVAGQPDKVPCAAPELSPGVASYGNGYQSIKCSRDGKYGLLEGVMASSATIPGGAQIGVVPSGFRPAQALNYTGVNLSTEQPALFKIDAEGVVTTRVTLSVPAGHAQVIVDLTSNVFRVA